MMTIKRLTILFLLFCSVSLFSQVTSLGVKEADPIRKIEINHKALYAKVTNSRTSTITLPFDKLGYGTFTFQEDQMLAPDFALARPDIKTYTIQSTKDASVKGRLMVTPESVWGSILTHQGLASFYPKEDTYFLEEGIHLHPKQNTICKHGDHERTSSGWEKKLNHLNHNARIDFFNAGTRRSYDLAVVCTGEYYAANGGTNNTVTNSIVATVNALNVIYENELSVRLILLTPFLYPDTATDPFIPNDMGGESRPVQASRAVDMNFDEGDYDVGHVFHRHQDGDGWDNGGVAYLGSVCSPNSQDGGPVKAGGWSGAFDNIGNGWISLAAHEFGHMFGATHTFNGEGGSCDDAISISSAYEIGSGTTIMSYQGICAEAQNIPGEGEANNYFHTHSLFQMVTYINTSATCATELPVANTAPMVTANTCGGEIRIPRNTPFVLSGSGTDEDGDNLTYTWEQYDEDGLNNSLTQGFIGSQAGSSTLTPLFRSFPPSTSAIRYFPQLNTLVEGANSDVFQVLPSVARTLNFQLTVRDNNPVGGGIASDDVEVIVDNSGPLTLSGISNVTAGSSFMISWSLNGTEDLCDLADILLSTDGGQNYSILLAEDISYDAGTFMITIPESFPETEEARIMLACADSECYSFFDITNSNFSIQSQCLAGKSILCDAEFETFDQGDAALNLNLIHIDGNPISSLSARIENDLSTLAPVVFSTVDDGCIQQTTYFTTNKFISVDLSGSYTFSVDVQAPIGRGYFSIYLADSYNENNPCASFVGASAIADPGGGGFFAQSAVTLELEACTNYLLIFSNNAMQSELPINTNITNIEGPGTVVEINDMPSPDYDHTFIAVNDQGIVEVVNANSDFTSVAGGAYDIYTVTYKTSGTEPPTIVDPTTWVGNSLNDIQNTNCLAVSSNSKPIEVDFSCRITSIEAGGQTSCDPNTNTFSQDLIITYDQPPITGNLVVNGAIFPITGSPQTVTLVGLLSDGLPQSVSATFSEIPTCTRFVTDLFTAPENCCDISLDLGGDRVVCDNEQVILDAGDDGVSYKWFRNGEELMISASTLEVTTSGNYLVEVVNATGCSKFEVVNITINPTPTVELGDDLSVCEGEIFLLQSETTASELIWNLLGTGVIADSESSILITEGGTYTLTGSNTEGCSAADTVVIEYVPRPVVDLGEDQQFCAGDDAYILDAGMDGTSYVWTRNGMTLDMETGTTLSVTTSGQYIAIVDNGGGCDATDTVNIDFATVGTVFAGNDINICQGTTGTLLSFIDTDSYEWFFNGVSFGDQSESPEVSEAGEYVLVGRNELGCETSDTVMVNEVLPPNVDLGDDRVGCEGSEISLSVDSIGMIFWLRDGILISSNASVTITEGGEYVANVIAGSQCAGRDTIVVTFEPGPTLELGNDISFCMGESDIITANTDGDNITWFLDNVEIAGETDFNLSVTEAGEYTAIVTGAGNCEVSDAVTVTVNELPQLMLGEDEVICDGESVTLMTDVQAESYDWQFEGNSISDESSIEVSDAGTYTLTVFNEFNCSASDNIDVSANATPTLELEDSYSICEGEDVEIIANSDGASFQWFVDGVELVNETENTITVNTESTIEVIASSEAGCTTTGNTQVNAEASPTVELVDDFSLCPSESFVLNAGDHAMYEWSNGQGTPSINVISINPTTLSQETFSVTVTNEAGCSATDEVMVDFLPVINGEIMASAVGVCDGEPVELTASGGLNYEWIDTTMNMTLMDIDGPFALAAPTVTTQYQVIIEDDCPNNFVVATIDIEVFEAGEDVDAGEDDCAVNGSELELNATGGVAYAWEDNGTFLSGLDSENPIVSPERDTVYFVNITDENGCIFRDSVNICVLEDPLEDFKLVTIITPNGDGDNDELKFEGLEAFPDNTLTIYNRWGYPVFERNRYQTDGILWNGENGGDMLPADTYYYILTFDGNTYKSDITIMR